MMVVVLYVVFPVRRRLMALPVVVVGVLTDVRHYRGRRRIPDSRHDGGPADPDGSRNGLRDPIPQPLRGGARRGDTPAAGLIDALTHIGPAVGTAVLATILGFVTLSLSAVPAVRDFGRLLALGVAVLLFVALFALNAMLYRFDKPKGRDLDRLGRDPAPRREPRLDIGRYLAALAGQAVRFGPIVVLAGTVLAVGGFSVDHLVAVQTDVQKLVPADAPGLVAMNKVSAAVGSSNSIEFLVTAPDVTSPTVLSWIVSLRGPRSLGASSDRGRYQPGGPDATSARCAGSVLGRHRRHARPDPDRDQDRSDHRRSQVGVDHLRRRQDVDLRRGHAHRVAAGRRRHAARGFAAARWNGQPGRLRCRLHDEQSGRDRPGRVRGGLRRPPRRLSQTGVGPSLRSSRSSS